jgi:hypothetical protein
VEERMCWEVPKLILGGTNNLMNDNMLEVPTRNMREGQRILGGKGSVGCSKRCVAMVHHHGKRMDS